MEHKILLTESDEEVLAEMNINFDASIREMLSNLKQHALRARMTKRFDALNALPFAMRKEAEAAIDGGIKSVNPAFTIHSIE